MRLTNHIAYRFLNDENLWFEILELFHGAEMKAQREGLLGAEPSEAIVGTYRVVCNKDNKSYYITDSVVKNLSLLKVSKAGDKYDWTVFKDIIPDGKRTFILPDNKLIRMHVFEEQMIFMYIRFDVEDKKELTGQMNSCLFFLNRETNEVCSHYHHEDVKEIEDRLYKILCFIYLSDTTEVLVNPGQSYGTKKSGKILNEVKHPLTVISSNWNMTSIRTEGFGVSGHFRLQPYGEGRGKVRVQWIDPFQKNGYVRRATKETTNV